MALALGNTSSTVVSESPISKGMGHPTLRSWRDRALGYQELLADENLVGIGDRRTIRLVDFLPLALVTVVLPCERVERVPLGYDVVRIRRSRFVDRLRRRAAGHRGG